MSVKEANVSISTLDTTQRIQQVDNDINTVVVVNSPTGPYEETLVNSVAQLINLYLISDRINSTDDTTILHAAKLLQSMPIRVIRAQESKIKSGINNNGEVIFTDKNYNPYLVSNQFNLTDVSGLGCKPYLGITYTEGESTNKVLFKYTESELDTEDPYTYSQKDKTKMDEFDATITVELAPGANSGSRYGMESFLAEVIKTSEYKSVTDLTTIRNTDGSYTFYLGTNTKVELLPEWIFNITNSNISSDATEITFDSPVADSNGVIPKVSSQDYVTVNGYSFFEQNLEVSNNTTYPGTSVPIKVSDYTSYEEFGLLVLDKLLSNQATYPTPIIQNAKYSVAVSSATEKFRLSGSANQYFTITPSGNVDSDTATPTESFTISCIQNDSTVITDYKYLTISVRTEGGTDEIYTFCVNGLPPAEESSVYGTSILISNSTITPIGFLWQVTQILEKLNNGTYINGATNLRSESNEDKWTISTTISDAVSFIGLSNRFRTLSSSSPNKGIVTEYPVVGLSRKTISSDEVNFSSITHRFVIKIDNYVFYNYDYQMTDYSEILVNMSNLKLTQDAFLELFYQNVTSYFNATTNILGFTLFDKSNTDHTASFQVDNDEIITLTPIKKNYEYELSARFAIINKYSSSAATSTYSISKNANGNYSIDLSMKSDKKSYEVSFIPGTLSGYGVDIYYTFINDINTYFHLIDLNKDAVIETTQNPISFGNEIIPKNPTITDYTNAVDKLLLETGVYYDFIITAGYDNVSYIKHLSNIAEKKYTQVLAAVPQDIYNVEEMVAFRNTTTINNRQFWFGQPYISDSTLGEFSVYLSPAVYALERFYYNKVTGNEFAPLFWKNQGQLIISGSNGSALKVKLESKEDRELLLSNQVNSIKYDYRDGKYYLNDQWTAQNIDSDLSDWNNVRMVNVMAHVADQTLDQFIARFNDTATRAQVVEILNTNIKTRMVSNQSFTMADYKVVCDTSNNTLEVIRNRQLVVDISVQFRPGIKYVLVYQRIVPLQST